MEKPEIVIGFDQSLTSTGFGVVVKDTLELLEYGTFKSKEKGMPRINEMCQDVMDLVNEYRDHKIYCVGVEGYAFNKKFGAGRVFDLAELGGSIKRDLFNSGNRLEIVTVQEHVKLLLGKGSKTGDKLPRIHKVNELYNLDLRVGNTVATMDDDIADGISLARFLAVKR